MMNARPAFETNNWRPVGFGLSGANAFGNRIRHAEANARGDDRAVLVGFQPEERARLADDLRAIGMRPSSAPLSVSDLRGLVSGSCSASHLFVNLDAFEDIEDGIDQLMALRTAVRNMTVILCSAHIRGDDLGSERSALCDVTLKLPVAETRLRAGLRAARENRQDMRFE